jgi:hypothetical protein
MRDRRRVWLWSDAFLQAMVAVGSFLGLGWLIGTVVVLLNAEEAKGVQSFAGLAGMGFFALVCLLLAAVRVRKIRWLQRKGVEVAAEVTDFSPGGRGTGLLYCRYAFGGTVFGQRIGVANTVGAALLHRGSLDLLIDPSKPRDYVIAGGPYAA